MRRKKRVRMHLVEPKGSEGLPSVEGYLMSKRAQEYVISVPRLIVAVGANPAELESRYLIVPRERVAFYEVLQ